MAEPVFTKGADRVIAPSSASHRPSHWQDVGQLLLGEGLLSNESEARVRAATQETGEDFGVVATRLGLISETSLCEAVAKAAGVPIIDVEAFPAEPLAVDALSKPFLLENRVLPIAVDAERVTVAVTNPLDPFLPKALKFVFNRRVDLCVARASDLDAAIDRLYGDGQSAGDEDDGFASEDDVEMLRDLVSDAPVIRAVNRLIVQASDLRASDIHLEPTDDRLAVRFRIDGMLHEQDALPATMRAPLVSRIKVMSGLNIAEKRLPQDGRLRLTVRGHEVDLRVATSPSIHGESVVMRILDRSKLALDFASLGFDASLAGQLRAAIQRPFGIVLVTGPTGSGKTTTLYAALSELNVPQRKLLTIEDPIEYRLPGIVQTQINPAIGFTFGSALRSFLRQDPDVMMVGEIRDTETAQIAVQAALTGHMILSTLHTNSAAGAVTRLIDMEVEPFLLSSVLSGVLAQRLVRRLCVHCREPYKPDAAMLPTLAASAGLPTTLYRPKGCAHCGGSGYAGRIALLEFIGVDDEIARLILKRADTREIGEAAAARGMRSLLEDGIAKAAAGLTTIEEALRVASGD